MDKLLSVFLPAYFLAFFGFAFLWRSWRTWRSTGINPYRLNTSTGVEALVHRYFRLMPLLSLGVLVCYLLPGDAYALLAPITWLEFTPLQMFGMALMTAALVIMLVAQSEMGASWRIGVDHEHATEFVRAGLFRYSRNPIFLGVLLSVFGYFLVLPNAVTLLTLVLDLVLMQVQIQLEEEHLSAAHGEAYEDYCCRVRRWL